MEKDTVVISSEEYKGLILKEKELEEIQESINVDKDIFGFTIQNRFETIYLEKIYIDSSYEFRNMKEEKFDDYYYNIIQNKFLKDGIDDLNYINEKIKEFKSRYDKEQKEEDNNNE